MAQVLEDPAPDPTPSTDLGGTFGLAALDTLRQIADARTSDEDADTGLTAEQMRERARRFIATRVPRVQG